MIRLLEEWVHGKTSVQSVSRLAAICFGYGWRYAFLIFTKPACRLQ